MTEKPHPWALLIDAGILFALILALALGADIKFVVLAYLILEMAAKIMKAIAAVADLFISSVTGNRT